LDRVGQLLEHRRRIAAQPFRRTDHQGEPLGIRSPAQTGSRYGIGRVCSEAKSS
jgi:hypothetical protein